VKLVIPEHWLLARDQKWIIAELGQQEEKPLWRARWAEPDPLQALVHQYFFEAKNLEAAHAKIIAWIGLPAHPLPANARIVQEQWCSPCGPECTLPIWRVSWLESGEKHVLFLFEPHDQEGAALRACFWARRRQETLEHFEMLSRLGGIQRYQAWFDPEEGQAIFAL